LFWQPLHFKPAAYTEGRTKLNQVDSLKPVQVG